MRGAYDGMSRIVVIGSINMDLVNHVAQFPQPGETIRGRGVEFLPGGKGANQAVAASRAGGRVEMIGAVGQDSFAAPLLDSLRASGVGTGGVQAKEGTSGLAFITVSEAGENMIILSEGSNGQVSPDDIPEAALAGAALALFQNEIPWEANLRGMKLAKAAGAKVFYNPAPVRPIPKEAYPLVDLLVVNETEAEGLSGVPVDGVEDAERAAAALIARGAGGVLVTLGSKGSYYAEAGAEGRFTPARQVRAVDTTAAGDTFIGAFAAAAAEGRPAAEALAFATAAASIAVTRPGAQASIPRREEIEAALAGPATGEQPD